MPFTQGPAVDFDIETYTNRKNFLIVLLTQILRKFNFARIKGRTRGQSISQSILIIEIGIRCTRPLHVDRTAHIPPTSHVTSPRDVTHYSLNTFSLFRYLLQTAVGQCRPSLADASSAAGSGVRDRLPPWAWNFFQVSLEGFTGNKSYATLERYYLKKTPRLKLSCSLPLGTAPPKDKQLSKICFIVYVVSISVCPCISYVLSISYVRELLSCHLERKCFRGSFSKFLVTILFKKGFLTRRGSKLRGQPDPSFYHLLVSCLLWVLGALQLLSCYC